jgi:hypothetical protein
MYDGDLSGWVIRSIDLLSKSLWVFLFNAVG